MAGRRAGHIARPRLTPSRVPFERTAAYHRFGPRTDPAPLDAEDLYTKALLQEQGFDGLPDVVPAAVLDRHVQAGELELFRGVTLRAHADQLRYGELFVGRGTFGGGIYAAGGPDGRQHAAEYAQDPGGALIRMSLKPDATIANARLLTHQMWDIRQSLTSRGPAREAARVAQWVLTERASVYAAYLGYDGLVEPETGVWLILNRTALRVQREDERA
jgi:hypothetical protein